MYSTLIDRTTAKQRLGDPHWLFVDCRFDLSQPQAGEEQYRTAHIPGAVYAHLDRDLSGPPITNKGRHPLPLPDAFARTCSHLGIGPEHQVVVYDSANGSICARLWWLLQYMGHNAAAVLDGGWPAWQADGYPSETGENHNTPTLFTGMPNSDWVVTIDTVSSQPLLIDARDPARYRGEVEPIDPVAGHIPGALNHCWKNNLQPNGDFATPAALKSHYEHLLQGQQASEAVFYCGSGVTACHDVLAVRHAGLSMPRLYAGSWSEWCSTPGRAVATGDA